jgi:hypothetical protein
MKNVEISYPGNFDPGSTGIWAPPPPVTSQSRVLFSSPDPHVCEQLLQESQGDQVQRLGGRRPSTTASTLTKPSTIDAHRGGGGGGGGGVERGREGGGV